MASPTLRIALTSPLYKVRSTTAICICRHLPRLARATFDRLEPLEILLPLLGRPASGGSDVDRQK